MSRQGPGSGNRADGTGDLLENALGLIAHCPAARALLLECTETCAAASSALQPEQAGGSAAAARLARKAAWARLPPPIAFIRATIEKSLNKNTATLVAQMLKRVPLSREMKYTVQLSALEGDTEGEGGTESAGGEGGGVGAIESGANAGPASGAGASTGSSDAAAGGGGGGGGMPVRHGSVSGALMQAQIVTSLLRLGR